MLKPDTIRNIAVSIGFSIFATIIASAIHDLSTSKRVWHYVDDE